MAKNYNIEAIRKKQQCRKIMNQLANFVKIELGKLGKGKVLNFFFFKDLKFTPS